MTDAGMPPKTRDQLMGVSTATLTTALFKRGFRNTFIQGIAPLNAAAPRMVGPAYTLRYIPAREDIDHLGVFEDRGHPQRKGVEECPPGHVFVIDSRKDRTAASAGGILVARLWKRGAAGIVTDGGFRDSPDIARLPFPAYHAGPSAPTNLVRHHAADLNVPTGCGDVPVYPGDILVGDGEGVVVIPRGIAEAVAEEAREQTLFEDFVQERVMEGSSIFGIYPPSPETREIFARWRASRAALVRTGDMISVDVATRTIRLEVPDEELGRRRGAWTPPPPRYERGFGWLSARHITQAEDGCDFDFLETGFGAPVGEPAIF